MRLSLHIVFKVGIRPWACHARLHKKPLPRREKKKPRSSSVLRLEPHGGFWWTRRTLAVPATLRIRPVFQVTPQLDSERPAYQIDSPVTDSRLIMHAQGLSPLCVLRNLYGPSDGSRRDEGHDGSLLLSLLRKSSHGRSRVCQLRKPLGNYQKRCNLQAQARWTCSNYCVKSRHL